MKRTIEYRITKENENQTIESFLKGQGYTRQTLVSLKKMPESVLVDGRWEYLRYVLRDGECLSIHIDETDRSEKIVPVKLPFPVIYEDEDIIVVNKPAGMPIHPSMNNYDNTLGNAAAYYFAQKGESFVFRCVNRLDRDTSGLTILVKHQVAAGILYEQMTRREIKREYLAIVEGCDLPDEGMVDAPIGRVEGSTIERKVDALNGERAVTHYQVMKRSVDKNMSLLSLHLDTGRTHQIRVHMTYIGHPLPGDWLYNPRNQAIARQALHSYRLYFVHPITKKTLSFEVPMPEDMQALWEGSF